MESWIDTYPHKIYASVLLLDGKLIDYKIGSHYWKSPNDVTLRGQITWDEFFKTNTKYTCFIANSSREHNMIFEVLAKNWIKRQVTKGD